MEDERKKMGMEALINSLFDDVREVTAAGPVVNRGDVFHNQFNIGLFVVTVGEFSSLTSEDEQLITEEVVMNRDTVEEQDRWLPRSTGTGDRDHTRSVFWTSPSVKKCHHGHQ